MRLDLDLVEVFCCVYEESSFSRAASRLFLSQPTISTHIKNLEGYIESKLFDRLPRPLVPTPAGRLLYQHGRVILQEKRAAIQGLKKFLNRMEGSLPIYASTIPGEYLLPRFISAFHTKFPAVKIELRISDSKTVHDETLAGKVEIGFAGAKVDAVGLDYHPLGSDELVLIVPNTEAWKGTHCVNLEELAKLPFLAREVGSGTRMIFEQKTGRLMNEFNVVGYFNSTNAIKEAVKAGLGAAIISNVAVTSEIACGLLRTVRISGVTSLRRQFYSVVNRNRTRSPVAEEFLRFLFDEAIEQAISA